MKKFTKIAIFTIALASLLPFIAFATPVSVDRLFNNRIEPLIKTDFIQANYFNATGTLASVFPYASTTALSSGNAWFTGNVGIGTTSPWGKLSLTNTGTGPTFIAEDSASSDITPFIIDAAGLVGLGTRTPTFPLDFEDAVGGKIELFSGYGFGLQAGVMQLYSTAVTTRIGLGYGLSGAFTEVLTVKGPNVGVGTTTPAVKFQVDGNTATSTIAATVVNGGTRSTTLGGRILLQDPSGGGCSEMTMQAGVPSYKIATCPEN